MKCHICDKDMTDKETVFSKDINGYEPCTICLDIALDAAYSDGFSIEDDAVVDGDFDVEENGFGSYSPTPAFFNKRLPGAE